eukprot:m.15116 g.15116  ORF g.15116 m.15116 type:complete len:172 (+) comp5287_c0_seq2:177-692(+)
MAARGRGRGGRGRGRGGGGGGRCFRCGEFGHHLAACTTCQWCQTDGAHNCQSPNQCGRCGLAHSVENCPTHNANPHKVFCAGGACGKSVGPIMLVAQIWVHPVLCPRLRRLTDNRNINGHAIKLTRVFCAHCDTEILPAVNNPLFLRRCPHAACNQELHGGIADKTATVLH